MRSSALSRNLDTRISHVHGELERLNAKNNRSSAIPLHYAVRSALTILTEEPQLTDEDKVKARADFFRETLEYLGTNSQLDQGSQVKDNLRRILNLLDNKGSRNAPNESPASLDLSQKPQSGATTNVSTVRTTVPGGQAALQKQLDLHERTLQKLQLSAAVYELGAVPSHLQTQMEHEEEEIERLRAKLAQ